MNYFVFLYSMQGNLFHIHLILDDDQFLNESHISAVADKNLPRYLIILKKEWSSFYYLEVTYQ